MSAYRIFINNLRVATAVSLESGEFLQVYPSKRVFPCKEQWASDTFWANRLGAPRSYTLGLPDGSKITYGQEKYKLFHDGKCASVGFRVGDAYIQRYPYFAGGTRIQLISERAPLFGVETCLYVKTKVPIVSAAPEPKERVSRWAKMTEEERDAWKYKMRMARMIKEKRFFPDEPAPSVAPALDNEVRFISARDYMREQRDQGNSSYAHIEDDGEDEYYGEEDFEQMHPAVAMVFRHLTETYGPTRKSHEPCDCGMC